MASAAAASGSLRTARPSDAGELARLVTVLGYPTTAEAMAQRLQAFRAEPGRFTTLVLEDETGIAGMIGLELGPSHTRDGQQGRIATLVIAERARGRGLGRRLVEASLAWLRERGARRIVVRTRSDRVDAQAFYRRLGFRRTGFRFAREL